MSSPVEFDAWAVLAELRAQPAAIAATAATPFALPPEAGIAAEAAVAARDTPGDECSDWIAGIKRLSSMQPPGQIQAGRWHRIAVDARAFMRDWGSQAARLGWDASDLFGVHVKAALARYDLMGLVIVLDGAEVVAMSADHAEIRTRNGARQRYFRRPSSDPMQVAIWDCGVTHGLRNAADAHGEREV